MRNNTASYWKPTPNRTQSSSLELLRCEGWKSPKGFTDANGRVTFDGRQGLHIEYNLLNLPHSITTKDNVTIEYRYLCDGTKVFAGNSSDEGRGTCYRGSFVCARTTEPSSADGSQDDVFTLQSVSTPEGRIMITEEGMLSLWYAKDYLGNVRNVVSLSSSPELLEENDYLPFGTRIEAPSRPMLEANRWRYAGKEEQLVLTDGGCALIDFGMRFYGSWSARWTAPDPLAGKYTDSTPFSYCADSPVNCVDPQGDTLVVLFTSGFPGHMALLVQNEKGEYNLYSKNADKLRGLSHKAIRERGRGEDDKKRVLMIALKDSSEAMRIRTMTQRSRHMNQAW